MSLPAPARAERRRWQLGAALAAEHFGGGTTEAGVDVVARAAPMPQILARAALGLRRGAIVRAADGDVRSTSVDAEVGLELVLPPRGRRAELALGVESRLYRARFSGEPRADAGAGDASATAIYVGAGLRGSLWLTRAFGLSLAAAFGLPVHDVDVFDGGTRVTGLSGPLLALALGASWRGP